MKRLSILLLAFLFACASWPLGVVARADIVFRDAEAPAEDAVTQATPVEDTDAANAPVIPAATPPPRAEDPNEPWPRRIVITVGGDTTLASTEGQLTDPRGFPAAIAEKGLAWPFSELVQVFGRDDLTFINFEGTLTEGTDKVDKKYNFKGPAEYARMLTFGSVEAVTLANNHTGDYGERGKADTRQALDAAGILYCEQGAPAIYQVRGVKIGLIGNTFPYKDGKRDITRDVKALREAGCQIVIASFHWGSEYSFDFNRDQRNIGRAAVRAGADAVVGHHPHVIQGIEKYEGTYILYSLANLVFGGNINPEPQHRQTYIAQLAFTVYQDGKVDGPELTIIPMLVTAQQKDTDYRPVFAEGADYDAIISAILRRSTNMDGFVNPPINR